MQFSGMALGYIKRTLKEVEKLTASRKIRNRSLNTNKSVQFYLITLQVNSTIAQACFEYAKKHSGIEKNLTNSTIMANVIKMTVSELMRSSSEIHIQLSGGNSFLSNHFGFNNYIDARPFLIFEGPNDMLLMQIARLIVLDMRKSSKKELSSFIKNTVFSSFDIEWDVHTEVEYHHDIDTNRISDIQYLMTLGKVIRCIAHLHLLNYIKAEDYLLQQTRIYLNNELNNLDFQLNNQAKLEKYQSTPWT